MALAIVATTLAAGLRASGALVGSSQRLVDVSAAQWCADNQLAQIRLGRQFPGIGETEFECEQLGRRYVGTLRSQPTPNPNFRRLDAQVKTEDGLPLLTVSTVVGRI